MTLCKIFEVLAAQGRLQSQFLRGTFRPTSAFLTFADEERVPEVHHIDDQ